MAYKRLGAVDESEDWTRDEGKDRTTNEGEDRMVDGSEILKSLKKLIHIAK